MTIVVIDGRISTRWPGKLDWHFVCLLDSSCVCNLVLLIREAIKESENGLIEGAVEEIEHRVKRNRILSTKNLRLGMVRKCKWCPLALNSITLTLFLCRWDTCSSYSTCHPQWMIAILSRTDSSVRLNWWRCFWRSFSTKIQSVKSVWL